ncbi:MAG: glycosyltransferase [Bacteroidota bacterium]
MLKSECDFATFVQDVPFEMQYSPYDKLNSFKILIQLPKMLWQVYKEQQFLKKLVSNYGIDLIIADSRYGFYHKDVKTIFITHQITIAVPFLGFLFNRINHHFIKKFNGCWVPDFEENYRALAGKLSRNTTLKNVRYIGPLSRGEAVLNDINHPEKVLYLLSGVEPQRSKLEQLIIDYLAQKPHAAILVRGLANSERTILSHNKLEVFNFCKAEQLQQLLSQCKYVVCRSGYSSIMDLVKWQKNAVLIPTPGQYEQQYLSTYLHHQHYFYTIKQQDFLAFNEQQMQGFEVPKVQQQQNFAELINQL